MREREREARILCRGVFFKKKRKKRKLKSVGEGAGGVEYIYIYFLRVINNSSHKQRKKKFKK